MNKSIAILLIVLSSTFAKASSESFVSSDGQSLTRRDAIIALAKGEKVFKLQEMTLGDKGTIHAVKKAGK